jgi:Methane/Phenol/Alkene Hydroxylase
VYAVRSAFARSRFFENLDPGWKAAIIAHYGVFAMPEYLASLGEARMGRFGRAAAWRDALHICDTAALLGPRIRPGMQYGAKTTASGPWLAAGTSRNALPCY